jgi:hypothetical protein
LLTRILRCIEPLRPILGGGGELKGVAKRTFCLIIMEYV